MKKVTKNYIVIKHENYNEIWQVQQTLINLTNSEKCDYNDKCDNSDKCDKHDKSDLFDKCGKHDMCEKVTSMAKVTSLTRVTIVKIWDKWDKLW